MRAPVIHIGYHKTGTSWLQKQLFRREDLGYRSISLSKKRTDFVRVHDFDFDPHRYRELLRPDLEGCERDGKVAILSAERLSGNPHSGGHDSKRLADRLVEVFPGARILVVIREQRAMILSAYAQYVRAGGACSLGDYLHPPRDYRLPMFHLDHFRYDRLIAHYQKLFGSENVLALPYEHFRQDPGDFVATIARFCGAGCADGLSFERRENRSLGPVALGLMRRLNPFVIRDSLNANSPFAIPALRAPARLLVRGVDRLTPERWNRRLRGRWQRRIERVTAGYYEESNRETQRLTGVSLGPYGYVL